MNIIGSLRNYLPSKQTSRWVANEAISIGKEVLSQMALSYLPSKQTSRRVANEAMSIGKEVLTQMTPHVPILRTMSGTLAALGVASSVYAIGPGRICRFILRREGEDRLRPAEIVALNVVGGTLAFWGSLWAMQTYLRSTRQPQQREFSEKDYLEEAKRNLDRWVKPKMTLKNPIAPLVGDSFVQKCVDKLTFAFRSGNKYPFVIADIKWDPTCWHGYKALDVDRYDAYVEARDSGSFSWNAVPVGQCFREIDEGRQFLIPRFLNPSWEDIPTESNDGITLFLRKPESCSMHFSWENSMSKYPLYRDVINEHGGAYDHCDLTDRSTWPDDTGKVDAFYRNYCKYLTKDYPGRPAPSIPECNNK